MKVPNQGKYATKIKIKIRKKLNVARAQLRVIERWWELFFPEVTRVQQEI